MNKRSSCFSMLYRPSFFIWLLIGLSITACQPSQAENGFSAPLQVIQTPSAVPVSRISPTAEITPSPTQTEIPEIVPTQTPDPGADDMPGYYDGLVITLDYVGQTIGLILRQGILLRLGEDFIWTVSVEPSEILTLNRKITMVPGEQGVYIARKKGRAVLSAVGEPVCRRFDPPCARPDVLFQITLEVK